jgi:hypothetical protein
MPYLFSVLLTEPLFYGLDQNLRYFGLVGSNFGELQVCALGSAVGMPFGIIVNPFRPHEAGR